MKDESWDLVIDSKKTFLNVGLDKIFSNKDLLLLFVKRDFATLYKQTILGPLWFFIQPFLTTIIFTIVFGNIAKISTDGIPQILFYISGVVFWNFFSDCFIKTSDTFLINQNLFGKVYFPRLIIPFSVIINNFFKFLIQLILLSMVWIYFFFKAGNFMIMKEIIFLPIIVFFVVILGLGLGTLFSALTNKYRDLKFLLQFIVQLLMYASPVVYPLSIVAGKFKILILLNPMSNFIEFFKYSLFGIGYFNFYWILYSMLVSTIIFLIGLIMFNRVEKSFIDTI
tara:strand:- start:5153 stop:5998 length:846 start_codon:yes stop_codon:yes gene_type:complete